VSTRRLIVWFVTLPLAIVGSQVAHELAYRLVTGDAEKRARELSATGHAYLTYLPFAVAIATVLALLALGAEIRQIAARATGAVATPRAVSFAILGPAIFTCQEHFERLASAGQFPLLAALEPTFVVGLLLQAPLALVAYAAARFFLRVARSLGRLLVRSRRPRRTPGTLNRPAVSSTRPRLPALALGYGSRGPPALSPV
jgi:hypothetical protein